MCQLFIYFFGQLCVLICQLFIYFFVSCLYTFSAVCLHFSAVCLHLSVVYFQVKMPLNCPLHFNRDVFKVQELAKLHYRVNLWTCGLCGKSFYREPYLDMHMDKAHHQTESKVTKKAKGQNLIWIFTRAKREM